MNAIILAAGKGSRLLPLTQTTPKPLLDINGEKIIERQIRFLQEAKIKSIIIVVGYLFWEFLYLKEKFPNITIVINDQFDNTNNFYSLFLAKDYLKETWIIEGDIYLTKNIFTNHSNSVHYTSLKPIIEYEWYFDFDRNGRVQKINIGDRRQTLTLFSENYHILLGISFWTESSCLNILGHLERIAKNKISFEEYKKSYWDVIIATHLNSFELYVYHIPEKDWYEIDSIPDLLSLTSFLNDRQELKL